MKNERETQEKENENVKAANMIETTMLKHGRDKL